MRSIAVAVTLAVAVPCVASAQTVMQPSPIAAPIPAATAAAVAPVVVPGGTPLEIGLTEQIASNTAHTGDHFQFHALEDVTIDGWVAIPEGALGEGVIVHAESAGGNGSPGKLQLQFDWIYGADHLKVKLSDVPSTSDGNASKGAASTATIASYLVLGPLGLFAHNFVRGKDVIVNPEQKIQVYVAQSVHVTPTARVSSSDGFAH
jgi:hypothetical protein